MGLLQDLIKKMFNRGEEHKEQLPDDVTRDNYLRSLRREDRTLDEALEKEFLKKKIAIRRKIKLRRELYGIKENASKNVHKEHNFLGKYKL